MIELSISRSSKGYNGESYGIYDKQKLVFEDIKQAKDYLANEYGKCKRVAMYNDNFTDKDGNPKRCGYIYSYRNTEYGTGKGYIEEHWIAFYKLTYLAV